MAIEAAHALNCEPTGQSVLLRSRWQRAWYELLREGFTAEDVRQVVSYVQREIRQERRDGGALKLSNLSQVDRFRGGPQRRPGTLAEKAAAGEPCAAFRRQKSRRKNGSNRNKPSRP